METSTPAQPPTGQGRRGRGGLRRRGRGGGGGQSATTNAALPQAQDPSLNFRPASLAPQQSGAASGAPSTRENGPRNNPRGGGRNRQGGGNRGGGRAGNQAVLGGRTFGAQLTTSAPASDAGSVASTPRTGLQPDAPEFRPGQQVAPAARRPTPRTPFRARRMSKSQAPDLASRIHEDISHGVYECAICSDEIRRSSKVWSCTTCWTVFHIHCIKKWAKNEGSTQTRVAFQNGDIPPPRQWRCPGCNLPKDNLPANYDCWCGKETDPKNIPGIPPHSCGNTCSKQRLKCPHPCNLSCHAGPCPPCTYLGPEQSCFCGKESMTRRCVDTDYQNGWSCQKICGDPMPNCDHSCQLPCHEGLCDSCGIEVESKCYCGKTEKTLKCCDRDEQKESMREDGAWIGYFDCKQNCERSFDCELHLCQKTCHPQDIHPEHCPLSPDLITHCPCGKTLLEEPRSSCNEPIPRCSERCMKPLPCGHSCQEICHEGDCLSGCLEKMQISCRCGRITSSTICHQGNVEKPQCSRVCRATLNCGRHECGERCCEGEKKATERQAARRKFRSANRIIDDDIEAEHICTRVCERPLKCGNHECQELCHKGPCGSCREAIFTEISCHCGRTVLHPPLPCGTSPPACQDQCNRPTTCGHPQVPHNCHGDSEECPKCPYLIEKQCLCGKKLLKNQACFQTKIQCGEPCGRKLTCGTHACRGTCHRRPGECEDAEKPCAQLCSRPKTSCPHLCTDTCHAPFPCNQEKPCNQALVITCECQNKKSSIKCGATRSSPGNTKEVLPCNDECLRLLRNQRLAKALDIDPATHTDDHIPYSQDTLHFFNHNVKWSQVQEREIRVFAADSKEKRLRFPPMKNYQRAFVHSLAEDFGFDSESLDPEPHRHVVLFKTPKFVSAPMKTLSQCIKIKPIVESSTVCTSIQKKPQVNADPFNALLLNNPRFALTTEELHADFARDLATVGSSLKFEVFFLPSEQVLLKPTPTSSTNSTDKIVETSLQNVKPAIARTTATKKLASSVCLCRVDMSLNVLRRDDEGTKGGWSQVAAKGAAPSTFKGGQAVGTKSVFTVLGNLRKKKEKEEEERRKRERDLDLAPDNWEEEAGDGDGGEVVASDLVAVETVTSEPVSSGSVAPEGSSPDDISPEPTTPATTPPGLVPLEEATSNTPDAVSTPESTSSGELTPPPAAV